MILVDTSVWIEVLRDKKGSVVKGFRQVVGEEVYALTRFTQLELLQGARNEEDWRMLSDYLTDQYYLEAADTTWPEAARTYYELRRIGVTVNSPIDCCIAVIAIENNAVLLHRDEDFSKIQRIRPLVAERFRLR
jgi:predicted nucleic acid-binding protein